MDPVYVGWLSILPPVIAIILALLTKEVIFSLTAGVISGSLIYTVAAGGNVLFDTISTTFTLMIDKADFTMLLFGFMLGGLVMLVNASGGAQAYGKWAATKIRSKRSSLCMTSLLGCMIFLDDYFNCLTVGTVMKPLTDRYKVSRAKLAYIIDATAAPICIIAPISTWAASVGSYLRATGSFDSDIKAFVAAIPYNFYALLSLLMVFLFSLFALDFGPMAKYEAEAELGHLGAMEGTETQENEHSSAKVGVMDMILPILVMIIVSVVCMLHTGGLWGDDPAYHTITNALSNCASSHSMVIGTFAGIVTAMIMYLPRKIMTFKEFMDNFNKGLQTMVSAVCILVLAWALGGVCRDLLSTPDFVKSFVETSGFPGMFIPAFIFVIAAFLSFATGTSWGTFGILIPIIVPVAEAVCPELLITSLAATLAGSVFGDHCSPISDTTILSSAGAGVNHLVHVSTQMVYALTVAGCSMVGYLIAGLTGGNLFLSLGTAAVLMVVVIFVLHKHTEKKLAQKAA